MENFMFSINATIPIFLVMVVGYCLRRKGMFSEEFIRVANKFNFMVTLPVLLFRDISGVSIREMFDAKFVLYCAVVTGICFFSIWGISRLTVKDKTITGAFVQASFRGSAAVMGIAFIQNMYGNSGMAPLMIIGSVPLYNIFSVIVLTFEAQPEDGKTVFVDKNAKIKEAFVNIITNPIILAIFIGIIISLLEIQFPVIVDKTIGSIAALATPLALITLGAGFEGRKAVAKIKPTIAAAFIKLILQTAIFLPLAIELGFRKEKLIAILIMLAAPATPSCYIMAKNMNNDGVLTASIVVATTLMAAFTLTFWIFVLKSFGLI